MGPRGDTEKQVPERCSTGTSAAAAARICRGGSAHRRAAPVVPLSPSDRRGCSFRAAVLGPDFGRDETT